MVGFGRLLAGKSFHRRALHRHYGWDISAGAAASGKILSIVVIFEIVLVSK